MSLLRSLDLNRDLVALSLAGLVGVASGSASRVPVASVGWVESGIADHDSEVSHSDRLEDKEAEADQVAPEVAVITVDDHKNNANQSEDVEDEGIYKVSNQKSRSSLACSDDTHDWEEDAENSNKSGTKSEKSEHSKEDL